MNSEKMNCEILRTIFQPRALASDLPASRKRVDLFCNPPNDFSRRTCVKDGSRILARGVHMSDGNAQEFHSLYVRQCIIHAFKRVRAVV